MGEVLGGALLAAYGAAGRILIPVFPAILAARARRGKEDRSRVAERWGRASAPRPEGPLAWVHAASVGETIAVAALVRRLAAEGYAILLTTVTVTGAATAVRLLPGTATHQFSPLDVRPSVRRFLDHWRPDLALFVESEVWPVIADELAGRGVPHIIVNARMSDRAFRRWRSLGGGRRIFGRITLALAQSESDARKLRALGLVGTEVLGNLKFDTPPPAAAPEAITALRAMIGARPFWLAASTHPGEEAVVAAAHRLLLVRRPDLVTAIVPRHPERGAAIGAELQAAGYAMRLRSRGEAVATEGPAILIADTLGELGVFYRVAPVAFVGGSIATRGGQNPIEAVRLRCAVIHGPNTANFAEVFAALDAAGGAVPITDARQLAATVDRLLVDEPARQRQLEAANRALAPLSGALERTLTALAPFLARGRKRP